MRTCPKCGWHNAQRNACCTHCANNLAPESELSGEGFVRLSEWLGQLESALVSEVDAVKRHAAYGGTKYLIHCGREQMLRELIETERSRCPNDSSSPIEST